MNPQLDIHTNKLQSPATTSSSDLSLDHKSTNPPENPHVYASEAEEEGFDVRRLFALIRRRRKVIGLTVAATLSLAVLYIVLTPRIYQASIDLLVNTSRGGGGGAAESLPVISNLLDATGTRSLDTEVEILRSQSVQEAAAKLLPEKMRASLAGKNQVAVQPKRSTDVITVSVQSRDPQFALAYSEAIGEAYRLQNQANSTVQYSETADYVGRQLEGVRKKLDQKRRELREFKEANNIVDLPTESEARVTRLNQLESALQETEAERLANTAQVSKLRAQAAGMAPAEINPETIVTSPIVGQLRTQLTTLETQRLATLEKFMPTSPEVKVLDSQIAALRQRLQGEARTEVGIYRRNVNPVHQSALQAISQAQSNVWAAQARANALRANIALSRQEVRLLPQREYVLSQLQGDLATYLQTFQTLSDKYQTLLISQKTPVANARIITRSKPERISPRVVGTLIRALFAGCLLALVIALTVDKLDDRVYTEDDAVQATGLPVLAHVPMITPESGQQLLLNEADVSPLMESFRMLRTQLSFIASYGHLKTLMVTSSQPGEGKSTVSANLAVALALNGKRVVLVDTDLRRPRVHKIFNLDNDKGFTTVVANECSIEDALFDTNISGLQVLTAGRTPPNPAELLDSGAARGLIEHLKLTADYVILDAPPVLAVADAQITSRAADGVLLVVSCQEARRGGIERTCEIMAQTGIKIVGMVLNKFTSEQGGYYGYYGYKYSEDNVHLEQGNGNQVEKRGS